MSWLTRLFGGKSDEFPADATGDVFRSMRDDGDDLSKPRDIDFNHVFPKEEDASRFAEAARREGYAKVSFSYAEELKAWDARVQIFMLPTYAGVTEEESKLDSLAQRFGGRADGWGCMQVDKE